MAVDAAGRMINTTSRAGIIGVDRRISRSKRFILFLITAPPTRLLTDNPYLDEVRPLGRVFITSKLEVHELPLL